jgi:hypothetical protein
MLVQLVTQLLGICAEVIVVKLGAVVEIAQCQLSEPAVVLRKPTEMVNARVCELVG